MAINQIKCSKFEQRSVIKFLVAEKCKPSEIYWKMRDKIILVKELFTNAKSMGLLLGHKVKKTVLGRGTLVSLVIKLFPAQRSAKGIVLTKGVNVGMKGAIIIDFLEKRCYCEYCFLYSLNDLYIYIYIYTYIYIYHHGVLHLASVQSHYWYVLAGRSTLVRPCEGVHRSTSLMCSLLILQQCLACLACLILMVFKMGGQCPYSCCCCWVFACLGLWHINICRLFNAKYVFIQTIS